MPRPDPSSFEPAHRELFALLRAAGWRPGAFAPSSSGALWQLADAHFTPSSVANTLQIELGGLQLQVGERSFAFAPAELLRILLRQPNARRDVYKILGTHDDPWPPEGYPVGEGSGAVLFVRHDLQAALIDHSLCGLARAPDPFVLLEWFLLQRSSPHIEHRATHQGARIADLL